MTSDIGAQDHTYTVPKRTVRRTRLASGSLVLLALLAFLTLVSLKQLAVRDTLGSSINQKEHQAVFLTNGQVYFGDLSAPGGDFYYLRHVYYLASQAVPKSRRPRPQRLLKLGAEIQGPEDLLVINKVQIDFVENLKPGGQVSRAIGHAPAR